MRQKNDIMTHTEYQLLEAAVEALNDRAFYVIEKRKRWEDKHDNYLIVLEEWSDGEARLGNDDHGLVTWDAQDMMERVVEVLAGTTNAAFTKRWNQLWIDIMADQEMREDIGGHDEGDNDDDDEEEED